MAEPGSVNIKIEGTIGWLIFSNEAKLNAISNEMSAKAIELVGELAAASSVKVIIMRGSGTKAFISGGDISKFEETKFRASDDDQSAKSKSLLETLQDNLLQLRKPLIAMIHGYCLGGGMGVALCADLRFGATSSQLGIPAAKRGMVYSPSGLELLIDIVGPSAAKDMLFSARRLSAEEAYRIGLLNFIHEPEALEQKVVEYASQISDNAPLAVRGLKVVIDQLRLGKAERDTAMIEALIKEAARSEDFKEATLAFMEKRKPVFRGC